MTELVERIRELRTECTQAPWQHFKNVGTGYHIDTALGVESNSAYVIANHIVDEANAELIALAPQMADELTRLYDEVERMRHDLETAKRDQRRLDWLQNESDDLRCFSIPTGCGDADIGWRVVGHFLANPQERIMGEVWEDDLRLAIDNAMQKASEALKLGSLDKGQAEG